MTARRLTVRDVDWMVAALARRRAALVPYAPVYWRPAANARQAHRDYLDHLLREGGGIGARTDSAFMIAAPGRFGVTLDDAVVPDAEWRTSGHEVWYALAAELSGSRGRFVCPVPERRRLDFARSRGFELVDSWWHRDVPPDPSADASSGDHQESEVEVASARLVEAPPVYDPGGPVLFLSGVTDPYLGLPSARRQAARLGCPVVVVSQTPGEGALADALARAGFIRHCDFLDGII